MCFISTSTFRAAKRKPSDRQSYLGEMKKITKVLKSSRDCFFFSSTQLARGGSGQAALSPMQPAINYFSLRFLTTSHHDHPFRRDDSRCSRIPRRAFRKLRSHFEATPLSRLPWMTYYKEFFFTRFFPPLASSPLSHFMSVFGGGKRVLYEHLGDR